MTDRLRIIHPGEILRTEFLEPLGMTIEELADHLHMFSWKLKQVSDCSWSLNADLAIRLARYFGTSPIFWMNLQSKYDIEVTIAAHPKRYDIIEPIGNILKETAEETESR